MVKDSTVLGHGGAGFPAGVKWGLTPPNAWPRYLVVNGDESEPGTYKDRLLMERDPHQLIEGCLIACYAAALSRCFLYIRGEMPLAHERVAVALNEAYAAGYIGTNILGSNFSVFPLFYLIFCTIFILISFHLLTFIFKFLFYNI